jgi:hypothetical protein
LCSLRGDSVDLGAPLAVHNQAKQSDCSNQCRFSVFPPDFNVRVAESSGAIRSPPPTKDIGDDEDRKQKLLSDGLNKFVYSQKEKESVMMHIEPFIQAKHLSGQHLPHAATYLNQKRFNDEMLPQATKAPIVQADGRMKIDDIATILKQQALEKHQNQINHEPKSLQ